MLPRITVEVPVLAVGERASDYEALGRYLHALRRPRGLHMTLLHLGVLEDLAKDVADWTKGFADPEQTMRTTLAWLDALPVLDGFFGISKRLVPLGGGNVTALEVEVSAEVRRFQVSLVEALHELLDSLSMDNIDDFILGSRALGFRSPRWIPHVAVGRPMTRHGEFWDIEPLRIEFGSSRIRNRQFLPKVTGN
ncbi:hypothetical protein AB6813_18115 [bacterium RCC_150]